MYMKNTEATTQAEKALLRHFMMDQDHLLNAVNRYEWRRILIGAAREAYPGVPAMVERFGI